MQLTIPDFIVIGFSLAGIAVYGAMRGGRQSSARDYFLSESAVPWWAVCIAIVATETSALTFLSLPGLAYVSDMSFLQLAVGYIIGRVAVAVFILPGYFSGKLETAYSYLESRFGNRTRRSASVAFLGTRLLADGVRLYATAIPLALFIRGSGLMGGGETAVYIVSIIVIAALTMFYVYLGGVRAVIWADVIQFGIYLLGAAFSLVLVFELLGDQALPGLSRAWEAGKFRFLVSPAVEGLFTQPYNALAGVIGGMFLSMASHGTDHLIIQRVLTTNNLNASRRAMALSGVVVFVQFAMFLFLGVMLWLYYGGETQSSNEVFSRFILEELPQGLRGLIVSGILAAAMSTLSGSISALSASTMMDLVAPLRRSPMDEASALRTSRRISIAWCLALVASAGVFIGTPDTVVELALSIASFTYGGLLGLYLVGRFMKRTGEAPALTGFFTAIAGMIIVILFSEIAWTWYVPVGSAICMLTSGVVGLVVDGRQGDRQ